jgi:hypothetical protein
MFSLTSSVRVTRPLVRQLLPSSTACLHTSSPVYKAETMKQVDVDEADIQQRLGKLNMDFVRKAERQNRVRATKHKFYRRKDWMIASFCFSLVVAIYAYTMLAIQQEKFLDDFDFPEDIDITKKED